MWDCEIFLCLKHKQIWFDLYFAFDCLQCQLAPKCWTIHLKSNSFLWEWELLTVMVCVNGGDVVIISELPVSTGWCSLTISLSAFLHGRPAFSAMDCSAYEATQFEKQERVDVNVLTFFKFCGFSLHSCLKFLTEVSSHRCFPKSCGDLVHFLP